MSCLIYAIGRLLLQSILLASIRISIRFNRIAIKGANGKEAANSYNWKTFSNMSNNKSREAKVSKQ